MTTLAPRLHAPLTSLHPPVDSTPAFSSSSSSAATSSSSSLTSYLTSTPKKTDPRRRTHGSVDFDDADRRRGNESDGGVVEDPPDRVGDAVENGADFEVRNAIDAGGRDAGEADRLNNNEDDAVGPKFGVVVAHNSVSRFVDDDYDEATTVDDFGSNEDDADVFFEGPDSSVSTSDPLPLWRPSNWNGHALGVSLGDWDELRVPIVGFETMEQRARFTVYKLHVRKGSGDSWFVFRRFTDFRRLNEKLERDFPSVKLTLPAKRWFNKFDHRFLLQRQSGLQAFVDNLIAHKELAASTAVRDFLCLDDPPGPHESLEESRALCEAMEEEVFELREQLKAKDKQIRMLKEELAMRANQKQSFAESFRLDPDLSSRSNLLTSSLATSSSTLGLRSPTNRFAPRLQNVPSPLRLSAAKLNGGSSTITGPRTYFRSEQTLSRPDRRDVDFVEESRPKSSAARTTMSTTKMTSTSTSTPTTPEVAALVLTSTSSCESATSALDDVGTEKEPAVETASATTTTSSKTIMTTSLRSVFGGLLS